MRTRYLTTVAIVSLLAGAACTVRQESVPGVSGPSEFALSLKMAVSPDRLLQDGSQFSRINVSAFDAAGKPIAVAVSLTATAGASTQAFGTLSASTVMTGTDANNPAFVTYRPPTAISGSATTVTIRGALIGSDSVTGSTQQVNVIVAPATILTATAPAAAFTATPFAPAQTFGIGTLIAFDASTSCGGQLVGGACTSTSAITSWSWNFGDNTPGLNGKVVNRAYAAAGTYTATLTVINDLGLIGSISQTLVVAAATSPTAAFVVSPTTPITRNVTTVNFNAATSTATPGYPIVRYDWNFGDGNTATSSSPTASKMYTAAGTYTVTLTVTDTTGTTKTASATVTVT